MKRTAILFTAAFCCSLAFTGCLSTLGFSGAGGERTESTKNTATKAESVDSKIERAKKLAGSDSLEDLETALSLVFEAQAAQPWNSELGDLSYDIEEKLYAAKVKEAEKLLASGTVSDLDKALKLVNEVLDRRPANMEANGLKTKIRVKQSSIAGEKAAIEQNIEEAKSFIKNGSEDYALDRLRKVLAKDPNNGEAKNLVADAKTSKARRLAMNKGYLDEAEKILAEALKDLPSHSEAKNLLADVKNLKAKVESCPFKVGSAYVLSLYTENGATLPKSQWKPNHTIKIASKSTMTESYLSSSYDYGFTVDTSARKIIFNNSDPHNVMYTNATYSSDLKTITLYGIDIEGKLDGTEAVFTLK